MTPLRRRMTEDMQGRSFSRAPALQTERHHDAKVRGLQAPVLKGRVPQAIVQFSGLV